MLITATTGFKTNIIYIYIYIYIIAETTRVTVDDFYNHVCSICHYIIQTEWI